MIVSYIERRSEIQRYLRHCALLEVRDQSWATAPNTFISQVMMVRATMLQSDNPRYNMTLDEEHSEADDERREILSSCSCIYHRCS